VDLSPVFGALGRDDQSWLGSARGTSQAQSIALVVPAFPAATYYPNGYFPSGIALQKYATGVVVGGYTVLTGGISYGPASRSVADGATTSGGTGLTSATAAFTSADVGAVVSGTGIPAGTTIASVTNGTTAVMSANASATGTGVSVAISGSLAGFLLTATAAPRNSASTIVQGALLDTGRIVASKLPVAISAAVQSTNPRFVFI
jgi:hypothetical protein